MNAATLPSPVYFGVAGWSYPDWEGYVYRGRVADKLRFIAGYVDLIEINTTFYRPPSARQCADWVQRVGDLPAFTFSAKLHRDITHTGVLEPALVRDVLAGLEPLRSAGRLRHLLAQFKWDFRDGAEARRHLERIRAAFGAMANLVVELRHVSWQADDALRWLGETGLTPALLDYPVARNSFNLDICDIGAHGYLRLHGRNAQAWFDRQAGRDQVYDYHYSKAEMAGIRDRIERLAQRRQSLTVVANNHYHGQEMANALYLKAVWEARRVPVPAGLIPHYPELREIAAPEPVSDGLFPAS